MVLRGLPRRQRRSSLAWREEPSAASSVAREGTKRWERRLNGCRSASLRARDESADRKARLLMRARVLTTLATPAGKGVETS